MPSWKAVAVGRANGKTVILHWERHGLALT
jgi:hypothetical protein